MKFSLGAKSKVAWALLVGEVVKQDVKSAFELFEELAKSGNPPGQMVGSLFTLLVPLSWSA